MKSSTFSALYEPESTEKKISSTNSRKEMMEEVRKSGGGEKGENKGTNEGEEVKNKNKSGNIG